MKAITCSQCGALIKGISAKKDLAECKYCGAEIPVLLEKIFEVPDKPAIQPPKLPQFTENEKANLFISLEDDSNAVKESNASLTILVVIFICVLAAIIPISLLIAVSSPTETNKPTQPPRIAASSPTVYKTPIIPPIPVDTATPYPDFSYRAYVKHFTNIGVEDIVIPTIKADQLPTMDLVELKKTVFKEKRIRVRIVINPDGEVIEAKALNGHPVLQNICIIAAKKSLFTTRKKNYTTDLTYIFVIEG